MSRSDEFNAGTERPDGNAQDALSPGSRVGPGNWMESRAYGMAPADSWGKSPSHERLRTESERVRKPTKEVMDRPRTYDDQAVKSRRELEGSGYYETAKHTYRGPAPGRLPKNRVQTALTAVGDLAEDLHTQPLGGLLRRRARQ